MKHLYTSLVFALLLFIPIQVIAQWELRYPDIPSDYINDLFFTTQLNGYFVNEGGDLIQTTDGGITWTIKKFLADQDLNEIKFIDDQTGFAYSTKSVVSTGDVPLIYTTDGGNTWNDSQVALWGALTFLPISSNRMVQANSDGIQTLNNFYGNWQTTYSIPTYLAGDSLYQWEENYGNIFRFELLSNGNILAIGNSYRAKYYNKITDSISYILQSVDNGDTWDTLWCDLPYELKSISFINDKVGWIGGEQNRIYKTTDGGLSWSLQFADTVSTYPYIIEQIFALDEMNIFASTLSGFLQSNDGGNTWQSKSFPGINSLKVLFKDPMNGIAYGSDFLKTTDGGQNWDRISKSIKDHIIKIDFTSSSNGWALSYDKLYKTTDGGYNWLPKFTFNGGSWDDWGLKFIDSSKGYVIGNGNAYNTFDGGLTWNPIVIENGAKFFGGDVDYCTPALGVLCNVEQESVPGSRIYDIPSILVTTDGGAQWIKKTYSKNAEYGFFKKLRFVDPQHLYGINMRGLWISSDTASSWQLISSENYFLGSASFDFINSGDGCYSDVGSNIKFTTNSGLDWQNLQLSKYIAVNDYQMVGKDIFGHYRIVGVGDDGRLLTYTLDDYKPDYYPKTYTSADLKTISLYMENRTPHLWAGGEGFTILHRISELVSDIYENPNATLTDYSLFQNFPNPFNNSTIIRYSIPSEGLITLKIYNILGEEITTLVNETKPAGNYEATFNSDQLTSGVYLYKLTSGGFSETKKMLLLK